MTDTLVIEQNCYFREGLQTHLIQIGHRIVASLSSVEADTAAIEIVSSPDLVIIGPGSAGVATEELASLRSLLPKPHNFRSVVLLDVTNGTASSRLSYMVYDAVLSKDLPVDVLSRALELVALGQQILPGAAHDAHRGSHLPRAAHAERALPGPVPPISYEPESDSGCALSRREIETLRGLVSGASNKMIAKQLRVSEAMVKACVKSLLRKIGASNRTQVALWAVSHPDIWLSQNGEGPGSWPSRTVDGSETLVSASRDVAAAH